MSGVVGILLAAGAGSRMGTPKALVRDPDGTSWLVRSVGVLREGGCAEVYVVLGAAAEEAERLLADGVADPGRVHVVRAGDWADGMAASLRAGLAAVADVAAAAAVVHLVDLPDVPAAVVRRVTATGDDPAALARATYDGRPGHPVVLGRDHWAGVVAGVSGDEGARRYLSEREVLDVECGDLATGRDHDRPATGSGGG